MEKRIYRNEHDRVIAGVASGVADYLAIEKTITRLLFVLATVFLFGSGIIVYIVLWMIAPVNNDPNVKFQQFNDFFNAQKNYQQDTATKWNTPNSSGVADEPNFNKTNGSDPVRSILGGVLLLIGLYLFFYQQGWIPFWFSIFHVLRLWPLAIIALGVVLIFRKKQQNDWEQFNSSMKDNKEVQDEKPTNDSSTTN